MPLQPQRLNIPIAGGLSQDETTEYLDPPALYQCENFYHRTRTSLVKRNGYDSRTPIVDSRGTTRDMTVPLLGASPAPIDRFIKTGTSCTFAARGYLWTYDPLLFSGANLNPKPNAIRHGEIPDLQIKQNTVVSLDGATYDHYITDATSAVASNGTQCVNYIVKRTSWEWHVKLIDDSGSTISDTILQTSATQLMHPCLAAHSGGFVATVLDFDNNDLFSYGYSFNTLQWTVFSWPAITWNGPRNDDFYYYDMVGSGGDTFTVIQCIGEVWWVPPGSADAGHELGALIEYQVSASTGQLIYGPKHIGKTDWAGTQGPWPVFSAAGDDHGNYAGVWYEALDTRVRFTSFSGDQYRPTITVQDPGDCVRVGLGVITPTNDIDAKWNVLWQIRSDSLTAGSGNNRYSTYSAILSSTQAYIGHVRAYYATGIASAPFSVNGGSYAVLIPDLPFSSLSNVYSWGDIPWVLTRTWNDQWRGDPLESSSNYQYPMGVWGYGSTYRTIQPFRINLDLSSQSRKAFGALVTADVFSPLVGNTVNNITFDPTGPDRYASAPIPGGGAIFGCAQPWIFDGTNAFEAAFIHRPIVITQTQTASGGTLRQDVADDSFHYFKAIYECADERGRITRSPVSQAYQIKIAANGTQITLRVSNLFWNARKPNTVKVKVYISQDAANYVLAGSGTCATYDDTDIPDDVYVTITGYPPATAPAIYTQDGSVESSYPQLASHLVRWNNRIWIADGRSVSYSHAFIDGDQVSFTSDFVENIDTDVTALCPLDDRVLLFGDNVVMARTGEGPAPGGQGSTYSNWMLMTHEVGCTNSRSVFHSMVGVFFQSKRGLELMDAAGAFMHQRGIENYFAPGLRQGAGDMIVGVLSLPRDHQARILVRASGSNNLKQLVFDYSTGTWSRWSGNGLTAWNGDSYKYVGDITVVGDQVYMADRYGVLYVEANGRQWDQSFSTDYDVPPTRYHIDWEISSPWIKAEGLQGFQRIWRSTISLKCQEWQSVPYGGAPSAQMGIGTTVNIDYSDISERHPSKSIGELQVLRNSNSAMVYLTIGHKYQQCRSYQINLFGKDSNIWSYLVQPQGVYEILGLWSELGIEGGTGRGRDESKV